jgi:predicted Zn-dependent protease
LGLANDSAEIAAVMAHEIAHVSAHHAQQRDELEKNNAMIARVAGALQGPHQSSKAQTQGLIGFAKFSRQQEFDADEYGIETMAQAGYDPKGAVRILKLLARYAFLRDSLVGLQGQKSIDLLSTHPSTPQRIAHAQDIVKNYENNTNLRSDRQGYLAAIEGIAFGDNPDDGLIRGRRFVHPRLGFSFIAPDDFVLENSAQAVVGVAQGGAQALRLDSVKLSTDQTLENYLASGWVDGLLPHTVATTQINGLAAATAQAQSGPWSFRIAIIRLGTNVYRLIYAAQRMDEETERQFTASIASFRRVSIEEANHIHPLFIAEVTVSEATSAEILAGQMAISDRPLEHFLLINGLEKGGPLQKGEIYKIIREN